MIAPFFKVSWNLLIWPVWVNVQSLVRDGILEPVPDEAWNRRFI